MFSENCLPRLKPSVEFTKLHDSVVLTHGEDSLLNDENADFLKSLCDCMDGQSRVETIISRMLAAFPELESQAVTDAIQQLDELRLLEDNQFNLHRSDTIEPEVDERWCRNFDFYGSLIPMSENKYEVQDKLRNATVGLLGLGGLGSNILLGLAAMGVKNVVAADFDMIEQSNLNRQILYRQEDVGKEKAPTAEMRIKQFYPGMNTRISRQKFESHEDIERFIEGCDVVIGVADKPRMKMPMWMNQACINRNVTFISGGLNINRGLIYSVTPGKTGCISCWRNQANVSNEINEVIHGHKHETHQTFETPYSSPAFAPLVSVVTGAMLTEAVKVLTGIAEPSFGNKLTQIDFKNFESRVIETWKRSEHCPMCSHTNERVS
ncbi:HesA/MoeB/ThiF family protein [Algicola sagamiensis]|uniref:HesA/MoeB/ThiF family protein n=1 Tax=Algicola sagamiensis TaxID=163869 RepID=UPI00037E3502|nr:ThiF family adenylyltransferase [Algicola sagamiensis]